MIVKVTIVFLAVLLASALLRRAAAATRHAILTAGQLAALLLPLLAFVVPPIEVSTADFVDIAVTAPPVATRATAAPSIDYMPWLWALGFAAAGSVRLAAYLRAAMLIRRTRMFSAEVAQPVTFFSRIILPSEAANWDDARLRAVLLHDGAHVARRDTLLGIIGDLVCAVYWFHPLAWLTARRARLERERACDDAVLAHGVAPVDYAAALVDVARSMHRGPALAMAEPTDLTQRVQAILDSDVNRRATRVARAAVAAAMLTAAPLLAALTTLSIPLPRAGEPDLRGDAVASPFSERIGAPHVDVIAAGPDAAFIARMQEFSMRAPQTPIDFVADRARWALARSRNGELIAPLIQSLDDSDWRVRAYAAWALGFSADARATAPLVHLLEDDIWRVRACAAYSLWRLADPAAAPAMKRALSDDAWQVRAPAVHYFAATGGSRELFQTMLRDRHLAVRYAAEEALR